LKEVLRFLIVSQISDYSLFPPVPEDKKLEKSKPPTSSLGVSSFGWFSFGWSSFG
jgi:hypothetical protein